jgi:predicted RNase H-like nuclease (RuvC/YqgF family)
MRDANEKTLRKRLQEANKKIYQLEMKVSALQHILAFLEAHGEHPSISQMNAILEARRKYIELIARELIGGNT